jgi:hypothetical protein
VAVLHFNHRVGGRAAPPADIYIGKAFVDCAKLAEKRGSPFESVARQVLQHIDEELARLITQHGEEAVDAAIKESQQHPEPALGFVKRRLNLGNTVIMMRSPGSEEFIEFGRASRVTIEDRLRLAPYDHVLFTKQTYNSVDRVNLTAPLYSGIDVKICKGCKTEIYGKGQYCDRHKVPKPARGRAAKQFYKGRGG